MIRLLLIVGLLAFLAHACKGICDDLQFHYSDTRWAKLGNDRFWNPQESWVTGLGDSPQAAKYAGDDPKNGPRFPGSTTWLAWTTDAWHLFQTIQYALLRLALTLLLAGALALERRPRWYHPVGIYALLWIIQAAGFHLTYTLL